MNADTFHRIGTIHHMPVDEWQAGTAEVMEVTIIYNKLTYLLPAFTSLQLGLAPGLDIPAAVSDYYSESPHFLCDA